jgi:para-nitrobenzyl esterase
MQKIIVWLKVNLKQLLFAFLAGMLIAYAVILLRDKPAFPVRASQAGVVQGIVVDGVNAYLGVPYAAPPVGALRWSKPRAVPSWGGVKKTDKVPPHCAQSVFGFDRGQEDCLYLNIWTPSLYPQKPLPVMVWIHGGGFILGHSYETTPGQYLAKKENVIVVSINYRLGAFGFMAHPELSRENGGSSGNYGMEDQLFALQWVRNNIKNFGGDANNVTLFGESAGGMSVCNLLVSPQSRGLFQKAIIESGPCFSPYPDLAFMEQQGKEMEKQLHCDTAQSPLSCMRKKTPKEILNAMPLDPGMAFGENNANWMPNIDKKLLLEQPARSLSEGHFMYVPIINGNNANEGNIIVMFAHEYQFKKLTAEKYPERIKYLVRDEAKVKKVLERYPLEKYSDPGEALSSVLTDQSFACQEKWTSDAIAKHAPVYSYYFSYPGAAFILPEARKLGAFHSAEIQFIFGHPMSWFSNTFGDGELTLSDNMMHYWGHFARTGDPNDRTHQHWPLYADGKNTDGKKRLQMDLALNEKNASDTDDTCAFWHQLADRELFGQ